MEALSRSEMSGDSVTPEINHNPPISKLEENNNVENGQTCSKYSTIEVEKLKDELNFVLTQKLKVHETICHLIELYENLKTVPDKVQVSEGLVDLIARVFAEIRQVKEITQMSQNDLDTMSQVSKIEGDGEDLDQMFQRIAINAKTGIPNITGENKFRWLDCDVDYLQCKINILRELLNESRRSLENQRGALNSEMDELTAQLRELIEKLEICETQVTKLSGENDDLGRRLIMSEAQNIIKTDHLHNQSMLENNLKDSEETIRQLRDEVSALSEQIQILSPSSIDLKIDKSAQTVDDEFPELSTIGTASVHNLESPSRQLMEAEKELKNYEEHFQQTNELNVTENGGVLRYVVPLMIFILATLIAFHPYYNEHRPSF